jgi:hypothetical protein
MLAIAFVALGCEKFDTREDPTLDELMEIAKGYLRNGDGGSAAEAFTAALGLSPTCAEAKYGLLISRNLQFVSLIDELVTFIAGASAQSAPDDGLARQALAESVPLGDYIQEFLGESADVWYVVCEQMYNELLAEPDPFFEHDGFTMDLQGLIAFHFGGRLDKTDLQFFGLMNSLVRAVVDIAMGHDLNFDFFGLEIPAIEINLDNLDELDLDAIADLIEQLQPIIDLLEDLLTDPEYPDFLLLKGEEGAPRMQSAGIELGQMFYRLHLLIEAAYRETGAVAPDTVHYVDVNHNGRGDRGGDPLYLPGLGILEADLVNGLDTLSTLSATAFWDTTKFDVYPAQENPFYLAFANDLLVALDILPFVIDKELLADLLEGLGIDPSFLSDEFEIVIPEIPYILPIDVGPWFAQPSPTGVRDLLWNLIELYGLIADVVLSFAG